METKEQFVKLLDATIEETKKVILDATVAKKKWMIEDAEVTMSLFIAIRKKVQEGKLPESKGSGLGIVKALGEWAPKTLNHLGYEIEKFYMKHM